MPALSMHDVHLATGAEEPLGESGDAGQVGEVELVHLDAARSRPATSAAASGRRAGTTTPAPRLGKGAGRLQPDARIAARDDGEASRQVDAVEHLAGVRRGAEPGSDGVLRRWHVTEP